MAKRRPRMPMPETLEGVLERAGEDRFARASFRPPVSERVWREAVGLRIAERARPVLLERGVLTLRVATSVWANELSMLQTTILERLVALRVAVVELRFRVGPIDPPERPPERRGARAVPAPARLPPELKATLTGVMDDELRDAIADAARSNLAWRAAVEAPPRADDTNAADSARPRGRATVSEAPRDARDPRSAETENDRRGRS
jgi:hypothetical protein